jgi:Leucine-rich repeat (LRR) protein
MERDAQSEPAAKPMPKRHWFQYGTRALLVVVTVLGVALGKSVSPAVRQHRAVTYFESLGGRVWYADQETAAERYAPDWLQRTLGRDHFAKVVWLDLSGTPINDAELVQLQGLPRLEWLDLSRTQVSDAGLVQLQGLTTLTTLDLRNTTISNAGLAHLQGMNALKWLYLSNTPISDAGLANLWELTSLQGLVVVNTEVSDAGVAQLQAALPDCLILH